MENSMNSMMEKARSSSESPEESSWTMYLDENFLTNSHDDRQHSSSFSSGFETSIVSDAASIISKNVRNIPNEAVLGFSYRSSPSSIIKRKAKKALLHDDALEDTATSPANSPKVWRIRHLADMKQHLQRDNRDIVSKENGSTSGNVDGTSPTTELDFNGRESDCAGLKKKGLCLVPFSMVANYFG
ncbi:vascular-related unknown protein 4-like [Argentina anserina]|uniref:vascular-related unknown protein 4-like n=1 Tax=Argentina anserina TaxID=57926 RepID=UPI0021761F28|nr:vascular-related unknown protein 4-like [Potentilla anserina]